MVVIVLLVARLGVELRGENSFVLDFTKAEQMEKLEKEMAFQKEINKRLEQMLAEQGVGSSPIRNVAVNRSSLKDDRGTDADKLYKDAERLQKELNQGFDAPSADDVAEPVKKDNKESDNAVESSYKGPSVVSYELEGRKASKLPIPAYRCIGGGEVKVIITVDNSGTVTGADIDESASSPDKCLRDFAKRAARLSRFSADPKATPRQKGYIVYSFIAQ